MTTDTTDPAAPKFVALPQHRIDEYIPPAGNASGLLAPVVFWGEDSTAVMRGHVDPRVFTAAWIAEGARQWGEDTLVGGTYASGHAWRGLYLDETTSIDTWVERATHAHAVVGYLADAAVELAGRLGRIVCIEDLDDAEQLRLIYVHPDVDGAVPITVADLS